MGNVPNKHDSYKSTKSSKKDSWDPHKEIDVIEEEKEEEVVEFESKLHEGRTASVYKGIWKGCEVVIKQFREEGEQIHFFTEMAALSTIHHPNIVSMLNHNLDACYIVLEFVVNGTLHNLLHSDHQLSWPDIITIAYDICRGMTYLHAVGIVHCDLRCENLLVTSFMPYRVKIFDFSSSLIINSSLSHTTSIPGLSFQWNGATRWQPPEVWKKKKDPNFRMDHPTMVDVYCFGMCLYEMISHTVPFSEFEDDSTVIRKIMEGHRPTIPDTIPSQLSEVIKKLWDAEPLRRPSFDQLTPFFQELDIHGPQLEIKSND